MIPETLHSVDHLLLFFACLLSMMAVGPQLAKLMHTRKMTYWASAAFFASTALTHLALLVGLYHGRVAPWTLLAVDTVAAGSLWTFVWCMYWDVQDKVQRVAVAIVEIQDQIGGPLGWWVVRRFNAALQGALPPEPPDASG